MGRKGGWFSAVIDAFRPRSKKSADHHHHQNSASSKTKAPREDEFNLQQHSGGGGGGGGRSRWSFASKSPLKILPKVDEEESEVIGIGDDEEETKQTQALLAIMAEAAGVVAHAAAEVARRSGGLPKTSIETTTTPPSSSSPSSSSSRPSSSYRCVTSSNPGSGTTNTQQQQQQQQNVAATKIQKAFRGYIARRAFRILRGRIARVQSLATSPAARKQADTTFRCMRMLLKVQGHIQERRRHARIRSDEVEEDVASLQRSERMMLAHKQSVHQLDGAHGSQMWNESFQSLRKSPTSQKCSEYTQMRRRAWMSPSCDRIKEEDEVSGSGMSSTWSTNQTNMYYEPRSTQVSRSSVGGSTSIRNDNDDDDDVESFMLTNSPSLPRYMCATHSARAKTRSLSNPKQRPNGTSQYDQITTTSSARKRLSFPLNDSYPNFTP